MISLTVTYFVGQYHSSPCHRQLVSLLANNVPEKYHLLAFLFATLLATQPDEHNQACLLAAAAPHSSNIHYRFHSMDYVRLDDDSIRVAIGLKLSVNLSDPYVYS